MLAVAIGTHWLGKCRLDLSAPEASLVSAFNNNRSQPAACAAARLSREFSELVIEGQPQRKSMKSPLRSQLADWGLRAKRDVVNLTGCGEGTVAKMRRLTIRYSEQLMVTAQPCSRRPAAGGHRVEADGHTLLHRTVEGRVKSKNPASAAVRRESEEEWR